MNLITQKEAIFLAYGVGLCVPPLIAMMLFHRGVAENTKARALPLALSVTTLILWMPILLFAPQVLISLFY